MYPWFVTWNQGVLHDNRFSNPNAETRMPLLIWNSSSQKGQAGAERSFAGKEGKRKLCDTIRSNREASEEKLSVIH
jgi:hypothetical protein